jgi:rhodanese-related sulfurtransferase
LRAPTEQFTIRQEANVGIFGNLFGGAKLPEFSVAEVAARLGQPNFFVFDNNSPGSWRKQHIPGAKNLDPGKFDETDLPVRKDATLVFYCSGPL